jgi:hypothetical protein
LLAVDRDEAQAVSGDCKAERGGTVIGHSDPSDPRPEVRSPKTS